MTNPELAALAQQVLDTHHAYLHTHLHRLEGDMRAHNAPADVLRPYAMLRAVLDEHLMKEERVLYPRLLALAKGDGAAVSPEGIDGPIRQMHADHHRIHDLELELRNHADQAGEDKPALLALLDDLAVHAFTEDDRLFAEALAREGVAEEDQRPEPWVPKKATVAPSPMPPPERAGLRARVKEWLGRA